LDFTGLQPDGALKMDLYGVSGQEYEILASSNALDWVAVATVMSTNRVTPCFISPSSGQMQLYRARALPNTPLLKVSDPVDGDINVSWSGVGVLENAPDLAGPWTAIGGVSPVSISVELAPSQFFRVKVAEN
jgi:hypothetical protein